MKSLTRTPGTFRARCRLTEQKPTSECTPEEFATATASGVQSRWDRTQKCEVLAVRCDDVFDGGPEEATRFEKHMAEHHAQRKGIYSSPNDPDRYNRTHRLPIPIPVKMWPGPRLGAEGKPLTKDALALTRSCPTCELVGEVAGNAGELWWDEHLRGCALATAS